jgi:radical SAM superfamily enzyme YgiQ (UPF0313 family)
MTERQGSRVFTLVEPCVTEQLVDRPNLGCAMLLAACREQDIPSAFVAGQSAVLRLLTDLDPETPIGDETPLKVVHKLYRTVLDEGGPRAHLSGTAVAQLQVVYLLVMRRLMADLESGAEVAVPLVDDYVRRIVATGCDAVGFSLQRGFDSFTREVRRRLRDDHGLAIIAGGPQITRVDPGDYAEVLRRESIDYLVTGPGELALPRLLTALADGSGLDAIPNVYRSAGDRVAGFAETVRLDLDRLPFPDFSDVDFGSLVAPERVLPLETARGCTWDKCAFCDHNAGPAQRYAAWSVERVVETLAYLRTTYGCHEFALHDLELPPGRARRLSRAISAAGLDDIGLGALARFSPGYRDAALWEEMRAAGFALIEWGLESGCQRTLDAMRKGTKVEVASEVLHAAATAGIANECFVMFGFPGETEEEARETIDFLRRHRAFITRTMLDVLDVQPHSPLGRDPAQWGVSVDESTLHFQVDEGIGPERAHVLARGLVSQETFDPARFSSEPVRSIAKINAARVVHGMLRTHRLLSWPEVDEAVADGRADEVFPVILGELGHTDGPREWRPVLATETPVVNLRTPRPRRPLDRDEARAFALADGSRSIAGIAAAGDVAGSASGKAMVCFVLDAVRGGLGLAFGRRWAPLRR